MSFFRRILTAMSVAATVALTGITYSASAAADVIVVPPGNQNEKQPKIFSGSRALTFFGGGTFKTKYDKVYNLLKGNPKLIAEIKRVAGIYGIDPIHILGAIVGEHVFNYDIRDNLTNESPMDLDQSAVRMLKTRHPK